MGHKLKVYHNGGTYRTDPLTYGEDTSVQTAVSSVTLTDSGDAPVGGQRVDLLRSNGSYTGVKTTTDGSGVAGFEILPGYVHKLKVYHNGGTYVTGELTYGDDTSVQTALSELTLLDAGVPVLDARVDLLRSNGSYTGVNVNTDENGVAGFEILPDYAHKFKAYVEGSTYTSDEVVYGDDTTLDISGGSTKVVASDAELVFGLGQNMPNPFNPETTIAYVLSEGGEVEFAVYAITGQRVVTLVSSYQSAGRYEVVWDGRDAVGREVSGGVYVCRMVLGDDHAVRKMLLIR